MPIICSSATTNFAALVAGETHVVEVRSKSYTFIPQVISVNENLTRLDFVGN